MYVLGLVNVPYHERFVLPPLPSSSSFYSLFQIDKTLSEEGMILPGIGDAGDRLFGTPSDEAHGAHAGSPGKKRKSSI